MDLYIQIKHGFFISYPTTFFKRIGMRHKINPVNKEISDIINLFLQLVIYFLLFFF